MNRGTLRAIALDSPLIVDDELKTAFDLESGFAELNP
jgi:hypothetical protein